MSCRSPATVTKYRRDRSIRWYWPTTSASTEARRWPAGSGHDLVRVRSALTAAEPSRRWYRAPSVLFVPGRPQRDTGTAGDVFTRCLRRLARSRVLRLLRVVTGRRRRAGIPLRRSEDFLRANDGWACSAYECIFAHLSATAAAALPGDGALTSGCSGRPPWRAVPASELASCWPLPRGRGRIPNRDDPPPAGVAACGRPPCTHWR